MVPFFKGMVKAVGNKCKGQQVNELTKILCKQCISNGRVSYVIVDDGSSLTTTFHLIGFFIFLSLPGLGFSVVWCHLSIARRRSHSTDVRCPDAQPLYRRGRMSNVFWGSSGSDFCKDFSFSISGLVRRFQYLLHSAPPRTTEKNTDKRRFRAPRSPLLEHTTTWNDPTTTTTTTKETDTRIITMHITTPEKKPF